MKQLSEYPKALVHNREVLESQFIFSLWQDPDLYGEYEQDIRPANDLLTSSGIFYYSLGYEMYQKGVKSFDEVTIYNHLKDNPVLLDGFNRRDGMRSVKEIISIVAKENIGSHFDELIKNNAVLQLFDVGYAVEGELDKITRMNYADLEDYMEYKLNNVFLKTSSNGLATANLSVNYETWINKWDEGNGVGFKVGYPMMNYNLAGIHKKNLILHVGGIGQGKAQPLHSKILTPNGYVKMGDVEIGMDIYGEDGEIHQIVGIYPQGKKDVYEITFNDGVKTTTCDEHIWTVQTAKMKSKGKFKDLTLAEIIEEGVFKVNTQGNKVHNHFIPVTQPLVMEESPLYVDPYYMGLLLGDGNFTNSSVTLTLNTDETDLIEMNKDYFESKGFNFNLAGSKGKGVTFRISKKKSEKCNDIMNYIRDLGLDGHRSEEKFIPQRYLMNSISNRIDLLSGLIDSDGEVNDSNYTFNTSSEKMSKQVQWLVQSLGGTARISDRQTYFTSNNGEKKTGLPSFRLHIKLPNDIQGFKSEKHKSKFKVGQREAFRCMTDIKYVGKEDCQCIMTNNPTHLYLTDNMIVTHNTTSAILMYVLPILESGEKFCIIANEQDEEQFRQMLLATVLFNKIKNRKGKMNRQKLLFGNFSVDEKEDLKRAAEYLAKFDKQIFFVHLTDYGTSTIKRVIKKYAKLGIKSYLIDTLKPTDESSDRAWAEFSETAKMLFQLAQKEDIAIIGTAQLASDASKRKYLDLSCIGKSRAIAETSSTVLLFRPLRAVEKEKLKVYHYPKGSKVKEITQLDPDKDYVVYFIAKNRYGAADIQIVYERNMAFNTMHEIGYCEIDYDGFN